VLQQLITFIQLRLSLRDERGATAVEYGLMVSLIAVVIITAVTFLGQDVRDAFQSVVDAIPGGN
jgi:pilus assembly protein Flp/PilA